MLDSITKRDVAIASLLTVLGLALMTLGLALAVAEVLRLPKAVRAPPLAAVAALLASGFVLSNLEFKYFWMVLIYAALSSRVHDTGQDQDVEPELSRNPVTSGHPGARKR